VDYAPDGGADAVAEINAGAPDIVHARTTTVAEGVPLLHALTARFAAPAVEVARWWRPDLLIHSQIFGVGPLVATALDIPAVEHGFGLLRTGTIHEQLLDYGPAVYARHGVHRLAERRAIDVAPPSVVPGEPNAWPVRFIAHNGTALLPGWLRGRPQRPRVAVTLGTAGMGPDPRDLAGWIFSVAPRVEAEFVLLLGPEVAPHELGEPPANVRLAAWVPLAPLLATCAAVVHHGGGVTILNAFDAGVPQLCLPTVAPNYMQSAAVQERGAGLVADPSKLDLPLLELLLGGPELRAQAAAVRAEMRLLPAPSEMVDSLAALVS
jgi:UDP:flavonoid glycosyltransferase YjiC (YdhE family)